MPFGSDADFAKPISNDFNRLGEKWANRRRMLIQVIFGLMKGRCQEQNDSSPEFSGECDRVREELATRERPQLDNPIAGCSGDAGPESGTFASIPLVMACHVYCSLSVQPVDDCTSAVR